MALVLGASERAGEAALRWVVEGLLVATCSALVFLWKHARLHRRDLRQ